MKVNITETILRDANQSLIATRLPFNDFEPILETIDRANYHSIECWGGATFDSCLRYLNEDPWDRLRKIKSKVKKTKLQMLLRGQNLLGYKHYPDDVVKLFIDKAVENGIDIIRIFDALNDFRNIETAVNETLKMGAHAQATIVYTISPIHSLENYAHLSKQLEDMGASSICIKDMAGIMSPKEAYEIVGAIRETVELPIYIHTHCTTGLGPITLLKAVEAGCTGIDTAISSFSGGTSQPATETLSYILQQYGYDTGLNFKAVKEVNEFFKPIKDRFIKSQNLDPYVLGTETDALIYQIPGGMLSNLIAQLKQQNSLHRLNEVLSEIPRVREDLGYPPLVTPMSQMVGTQAAANVLSGERYKVVIKEVKAYVKGEYGRSPGKIDDVLIKKVLGNEVQIPGRYADMLEPLIDKLKENTPEYIKTDEDILSFILFPQIAENFLKRKYSPENIVKKKLISYSVEASL